MKKKKYPLGGTTGPIKRQKGRSGDEVIAAMSKAGITPKDMTLAKFKLLDPKIRTAYMDEYQKSQGRMPVKDSPGAYAPITGATGREVKGTPDMVNTISPPLYDKNLTAAKMGSGGKVGMVLGAAAPFLSAIPGIGGGLSAVASLGSDLLSKEKEEEERIILPSKTTKNKFGLAYGGKAGNFEAEKGEIGLGNIVAEDMENVSENAFEFGGETHNEGGTDGMGNGYVLSDRIMLGKKSLAEHVRPGVEFLSKIKNLPDYLKGPATNIVNDKLTKAKEFNEKFLSSRESKKEMALGGPTGSIEDDLSFMENFSNINDAYIDMQNMPPATTKIETPMTPLSEEPTAPMPQVGDPIDYDNSRSKIPLFNPAKMPDTLTGIGAGLSLASSLAQFGITNKARKDTPKYVNPYKGVSKRAEATQRESLGLVDQMSRANKADIDESFYDFTNYGTGNASADRGAKQGAFASKLGAYNKNVAQTAAMKLPIMSQLAQTQLRGDMMKAEGDSREQDELRADVGNYLTQIGRNVSDLASVSLNLTQIAQNARTQSQALEMMKEIFPDYTLEEHLGFLKLIFKG